MSTILDSIALMPKTKHEERQQDLVERLNALVMGQLGTPFSVLGIHPTTVPTAVGRVVRTFLPKAERVEVVRSNAVPIPMERTHPEGLFVAEFPEESEFFAYQLRITDPAGERTVDDPYRFTPVLPDSTLERITQSDGRIHEFLGAHPCEHQAAEGVRFAVWAPGVRRVSVVGDFNGWSPRVHPLRPRGTSGVWELFLPGIEPGATYKLSILAADGSSFLKSDPCARASETRPSNASKVAPKSNYSWSDAAWVSERPVQQSLDQPISIYEVHTPSWRRHEGARPREGFPGWLNYRELADQLLPYVHDLGFTHVELLPITEYPLDMSWGYQTTGYFAPSARQGTGDDLRYFVDQAHQLGIGVILDWVPAHFTSDAHGLGRFVGSALYEHPDPRRGIHPDWGTFIFDYGRPEVQAFLISSALYWIEEFHIDGIRIDAVASMLYLDYSRDEGAWLPNVHGGRENLEAVSFLRELNRVVHEARPGTLMIAEESTAWPRVTHALEDGGLGFDLKWNMGWMHDTLEALGADPLFRGGLYEKLTFSIMYAFSERFQLSLSHDEVVHLKGSLLAKMPGSLDQKLASLRALYGYMWTHPGKKLLFMGGEFAQRREWDFEGELEWDLLEDPLHRGMQAWVKALNTLYAKTEAFHATDNDGRGFEWIDCHDASRSVLAYLRWAPEWTESVVVVANFAAATWKDYRLPVPAPGTYEVILSSDAAEFGGAGVKLADPLESQPGEMHGRGQWIEFDLPGLSVVVLRSKGKAAAG